MPIRKPKPTSAGRRFVTYADFAEVTKTEPEKTLVEGLKKSGGRNAHGRKTSRHRGGGAKRLDRQIDLKRPRGASPPPIAAAGPSACTAGSTSSAPATASRRRSPRSSTTPTGRPTSRC